MKQVWGFFLLNSQDRDLIFVQHQCCQITGFKDTVELELVMEKTQGIIFAIDCK